MFLGCEVLNRMKLLKQPGKRSPSEETLPTALQPFSEDPSATAAGVVVRVLTRAHPTLLVLTDDGDTDPFGLSDNKSEYEGDGDRASMTHPLD